MNNMLKKIISGIITASMLMSSAVAVYAEDETTTTTNPWAVEKGANTFRFGVMSDVHICPDNSNNVQQYMNMGLDAFQAMGVDGLALAGDITNSLLESTSETIEENLYTSVTSALDTYKYEIKSDGARENDEDKLPMVYAMGNHEMAANHQNTTGIWAAKQLFVTENKINDLSTARIENEKYTGDYVTQMGDYTFIMSSPNNGLDVNAYNSAAEKGIGVDTEGWVMEQIKAANDAYIAAGTPNKPIFYMQHIPVNGHYGQNLYTNTDTFMTFLKSYPNVIVLSAHVHELVQDPRVISQDEGYTSVLSGVMATGNAHVWGATLDSNLVSGGTSGPKQSMAIDVTYNTDSQTSDIKIYRLDIQNQEFIGKPFEFTIDGNAQTKYSTQARFADEGKSKAAWDEGTTMTAVIPDGTRNVTVTYDTAATVTAGASADVLQDDFVWGYKAFAINSLTNIAEKSTIRAAEFYKKTKTSPRSFTFSNLDRNQQYKIAIYPVTIFQQKFTYQELDEIGIVPMTATVKMDNIKTDTDRAQQTVKNTLVSAKKPVTQIQHPDFVTTLLTDNSTAKHVSEEWVNNKKGVGFIIDLERSYKLTDVVISVYGNNSGGRDPFVIYGSNDKTNWTALYERKSSDMSDAFGTNIGTSDAKDYEIDDLTCPIDNQYARYVKIEYVSYALATEIKVYADVPVTNVAKGKTATANCVHKYSKISNGVDGTTDAYFSYYDGSSHRHYYQVDLGKAYHIGMIDYESRRETNEGNSRSNWYAYGSNEIDTSTIGTLGASMPSVYTRLTNRSNTTLPNTFTSASNWKTYLKSYSELVDPSTAYQYITLVKQDKQAFQIGELKAMLVNPEVVDFEYQDGIAKVTFSEEMYMDNISDNIIVYGNDGEQKEVQFTVSDDNTSVTFEASVGDEIVIREDITNTYGTDMQEDVEYTIYDLSIDYSGLPTKKFKNVNVALGKNVISDYTATTYGGKQTLTNGENLQAQYVSATNKYFTVDLGRGYNVNQIKLKMSAKHSNRASMKNYTLSASLDGEKWDVIDTVGSTARDIWDGLVGTYNIDEVVNYRYIKYHNTSYIVLAEIEVYADVEAIKITKNANNVTSSAIGEHPSANKDILDGNYDTFAYVSAHTGSTAEENKLYNWLTVELDQAYPVGMIEFYVRGWRADGNQDMDGWRNAHYVKTYGSNTVLDDSGETANINVKDLTPYGYSELSDTTNGYAFVNTLFPEKFGKADIMPDGWTFTDGYRETIDNTNKFKYLTLKKYGLPIYTIEYSEFIAYVLNATVNMVDTSSTGVDIHFGDKMVPDLLNSDTITLKKNNEVINYSGSLSDNGYVYSLDAALADGFYTLTVSKDVKNALGVPMQADYTYSFAIGDVYGIKTADGGDVEALTAKTSYVVSEPVSGEDARMAIAAIYDVNNQLLVSSIVNIPADYSSEYVQIDITTPDTLEDGAKVKFFLWKAGTLEPVIEAIPIIE